MVEQLKELLSLLENAYEKHRKPIEPQFPYDQKTSTIKLPPSIRKELRQLVLQGEKVEAVKRVTRLTGAGLRVSKDYVDGLVEKKKRPYRSGKRNRK